MSERPYMPLYTADYRDATAHLSAAQHGAYLLLLMNYWAKGSLPTDDKMLARIACMSDREWKANRAVISDFFDENWKHARVEKEIEKARIKSEARAASGSRGGEAKSLKDKERDVAKATDLLQQTPSKTLASSSGTGLDKKEDASHLNARAILDRDFPDFWKRYPHKVGRADALKKYQAARKRIDHATIMTGLQIYISSKPPDRQWCNPSTWLFQERWTDEPAPNLLNGTPARPETQADIVARFAAANGLTPDGKPISNPILDATH